MAKRSMVGRSSVVAVVAVGVLVAVGCGGSSDTKEKDGAGGNTGDGTAGSGGNRASGGNGQAGGSASESGGGSQGGGSDATGSANEGSGGMTLPEPDVGTVGTECSVPGALQCAGTHQRVVVVCGGDGTWEAFETCPVGRYCDTRPGETLGSCQDPDPDCMDKEPGARLCRDGDVYVCGADTITLELAQECAGVCSEAQCVDVQSCPTESPWINCSTDCPGGDHACARNNSGCPVYLAPSELTAKHVILRTPSAAQACACDNGRKYVRLGDFPLGPLKISVAAPWTVAPFALDMCTRPTEGQCMVNSGPRIGFYVFTDDPDAPSTNVLIDLVEEGTQCS